uniref:DUF4806 domain-containing protein n=1 Tax=Parastrongyloides trichosuri TaxID=131310 RepID=A0A0N4ZS19_PARTI
MAKNSVKKSSKSPSIPTKLTENIGVQKNASIKKKSNVKKNSITQKIQKISEKCNKSPFENIIDKIREGVIAQKEHAEKASKNSLFPDVDNALSLTFTLKKLTPEHQPCTKFVQLPFPDRSPENTSVCLILPDISKSKEVNTNSDTEIEARQWAEVLEEKFEIDKSLYTKIYTLRQLRREVKGHEAIKSFSRSYDIFMCSSNVYKSAIAHLGSNFLKTNKALHPLCLKSHPKKKIEDVVKKTAVRINPKKINMSTKIGNTSQETSNLVENSKVIVQTFLDNVPGNLDNIRTINLGNVGGVFSLPVYLSAGNPNEVKIEKPKNFFDTEAEVVDELNTIENENIVVAVTKSGKVSFKDKNGNKFIGNKRKNSINVVEEVVPAKISKSESIKKVIVQESIVKGENEIKPVNSLESKVAVSKVRNNEKIVSKTNLIEKKEEKNSTVESIGTSTKNTLGKVKVPSINNVDSSKKEANQNKKIKLASSAKVEQTKKVAVQNNKAKVELIKKEVNQNKIVNKGKNVSAKRELTPPTLRGSAKITKDTSIPKVSKTKQKIQTPLKKLSTGPKVFVAETPLPKVVETIVEKKSSSNIKKKNGSLKKK